MHFRILLGALLLILGAAAYANPYLGVTAGSVDYTDAELNKPTGFEIKLGNRFNDYVALELSYVDFGEAEDDIEPEWEVSTDAVALSALAMLPIGDQFEVNVRVGGHHWDTQVREDGLGQIDNLTGTDLHYGVGMAFRPNKQIQFGLHYTRYQLKQNDIEYPNASFNYYFP